MNCGKQIFLTIASIIIIGLLFLSLVGNAVTVKQSTVNYATNSLFITYTLFAVLCGIGLIFSIYTIIWGNYICKIILSVLFIIVDLILIIFSLIQFIAQPSLIYHLESYWTDSTRIEERDEIEATYNCCGYIDPIKEGRTCPSDKQTCKDILSTNLKKGGYIFGSIYLILFVVLTVAIAFLIIDAKKIRERSKNDQEEPDRFVLPFAYGWDV